MFLLFPVFFWVGGLLSWKTVELCYKIFGIDWDDHVASIFKSINMLYWTNPWNETNSFTMHDLLNVFLNYVYKCFIGEFCHCVHQRSFYVVLLYVVLVWLWCQGNSDFVKWAAERSFTFCYMGQLEELLHTFVFKSLMQFDNYLVRFFWLLICWFSLLLLLQFHFCFRSVKAVNILLI